MRLKQLKHQLVSGITLLVFAALLPACHKPPSDEARLRQAIADMEKAAEAKRIRPILAYMEPDFLGNQMYRKTNIAGMLLYQFRRNQHVHVFLHITGISITGEQAKLRCEVLLAGRDQKVVPKRVRVLVIDSDWQKRDDKWRVIRASWKDPFS